LTLDRRSKFTPLYFGLKELWTSRAPERPSKRQAQACDLSIAVKRHRLILGLAWRLAGAVFEAPAFVAGLDDVAMMGEPVEQGRGHFGVAEHAGPFAEGEVGGNDNRGFFVEPADEVEQQLAADAIIANGATPEDAGVAVLTAPERVTPA